jgi:hypothetical protein
MIYHNKNEMKTKKRKAKRIKTVNDIHNSSETLTAINEHERSKEKKLLELIAQVLVRLTLEEFYGDTEPPQ